MNQAFTTTAAEAMLSDHQPSLVSTVATPPPANDRESAAVLRKKRRKRRRRLYILLAVLVIGGLIGFNIWKSKQVKPITVTVEPATRKTVTELVSATGKIQPEVEVKISPEVAGEIIKLPVVDGQIVKKGDLLISILPDVYQAQVAQQEAAVNAARAMSLQNHAQLIKAQDDLKRYTDLFNRKVINESDMSTYTTAAQVTDATYKASQAQIAQAESLLNQSRTLLEKTTIFSPIDGIISLLSVKLGERVVATGEFAGTEVMRVADLSKMEARVDVNENDVVKVKVGDQANITIDAYPNRVFRGTVYEIANTAVTTSANTQEEVTNFEVKIRINVEDARLRPGMSATADIETASVTNAVAVPIQAVTLRNMNDDLSPEERDKKKLEAQAAQNTDNNSVELEKSKAATDKDKLEFRKLQRVVFIKGKDGIVQMRAVETGIADNSSLEIKSGVQPDEQVVSGPYRAITRLLKKGAKVDLEKSNP